MSSTPLDCANASLQAKRNPKQRRPPRIHRPQEGSLFDIMHQHAGTSLFVRPICWTDLHARLIGAQFLELPPCDQPVPPISPPRTPAPSCHHMSPSSAAATLSSELTALLTPSQQQPFFHVHSIKTVMQTLYPEKLSKPKVLPEMSMYFGGRNYQDAVRVQLLWSRSSTFNDSVMSFDSATTRPSGSFFQDNTQPTRIRESTSPILAYIGKLQLASIRRNLFRVIPGPGRSYNEPVARLQQLRAKMLVPADLDHDPHFLGIFLAMAQRHFYGELNPSSSMASGSQPARAHEWMPDFHDVKVHILTHDVDSAEFIVYTAIVTATLLELFHKPTMAPGSAQPENTRGSGMKIKYSRVPIWPILGLKERLGTALGREIVGEFDEKNIEMWEEGQQPTRLKRKSGGGRDALAEVLNRSFDESECDESPVLGSKRRCLSGAKVGVVI